MGDWLTHPRPAPKHALVYSTLGFALGGPFHQGQGGPGGWWILDEPEVHIDGDILVPDIAGWRRERMATLPESAWFELAPDWLCEILSPPPHVSIGRKNYLSMRAGRCGMCGSSSRTFALWKPMKTPMDAGYSSPR